MATASILEQADAVEVISCQADFAAFDLEFASARDSTASLQSEVANATESSSVVVTMVASITESATATDFFTLDFFASIFETTLADLDADIEEAATAFDTSSSSFAPAVSITESGTATDSVDGAVSWYADITEALLDAYDSSSAAIVVIQAPYECPQIGFLVPLPVRQEIRC